MAIASCSVTVISRGKGRSAVVAAAYRAGQEMRNEYDGLTHNYTLKSGIIYRDILTPAGAPDWAQDRQQLWNMVEQTERRKDAQLAREVMIALPRELSPSQNIDLVRDYAWKFVEQGMIADVSVHDSRDGNPHAHIMLTMRPLEGNSFGRKGREWNSTERLMEWREQYAALTNRYLDRYGHDQRIDARSYEAQGIDQIPTVHLGPHAHRMEQRGIPTDRGDINREIEKDNQKIREILKEIALIEREKEQEKERSQPSPQPKGFDFIEHYRKAKAEIQKAAEELANRLTDKGRDILGQQQKNIENALSHIRQSGHESPSHPAPVNESERQRPSGEPSSPPTTHPRPQQEPSSSRDAQRGSPHPYRSPPLRRHREERHLAGERLRHRAQGQREPSHHALAEEAERRRKAEYDRLYEEPQHHSHASTRGKGRKMDYSRVYKEPTDENNEHRQSERNQDGPERDM